MHRSMSFGPNYIEPKLRVAAGIGTCQLETRELTSRKKGISEELRPSIVINHRPYLEQVRPLYVPHLFY
jgi:hypothetical protein